LLHLVPLLVQLSQILRPQPLVVSKFPLGKILLSSVDVVLAEPVVGVGKIRIQRHSTLILAGNLTQESDGASGTITYGRSVAGEVTSITNETYQDTYDPANLVSDVVNGPNGPTSYTLGNGLNVYQTYDQLGRLLGRWVCNGPAALYCSGGTQIYGTSGTWKGSQMQSQQDTVNGQFSYDYDEFNRLVDRIPAGQSSPDYAYGYDRYGNRFAQAAYQGGYSFLPSINATTNQITTSGYTYDAAGNMTNDTVHSYEYDAEGNLLAVDTGSTATYVYDAFNRRIAADLDRGDGIYL
jgi:YD repeat-containing protein